MVLQDGPDLVKMGFFSGYNLMTCWIIFLQAWSGLTIALVVKYADNILKCFSTAISLLLSALIALVWSNHPPTLNLWLGCSLVILAVYLYSVPDDSLALLLPLHHSKRLYRYESVRV